MCRFSLLTTDGHTGQLWDNYGTHSENRTSLSADFLQVVHYYLQPLMTFCNDQYLKTNYVIRSEYSDA